MKYIVHSKSRFRVHSPFVFKFINEILRASPFESKLSNSILQYYFDLDEHISLAENKGEGSVAIKNTQEAIPSFIKKVGLPKKYGKVLALICKKYRIENVLELGTSLGISTSYFANNSDLNIVSIEANSEVLNKTIAAFQQQQVKNVSFINAMFDDVLLENLRNKKEQLLVFIDGDHNKESTLRYFNTCMQHIDENTILIFDDIYWSKGMTEAWEEIIKHPHVNLSIDLYRMGILFFRKEQLKKEHFQLWF